MNLVIELAVAGDAAELTKISFAGKRFWGYPEEWIRLWEKDLTVTEDYITEHLVYKLVRDNEVVGFIGYERSENQLEIDHFWMRPDSIGHGLGRKLLVKSLEDLSDKFPIRKVAVVSDPNAEGFYSKMGFKKLGYKESLPEGRILPVMEKII